VKKVLLISESSVYTNKEGEMVCRGGGEMYIHNLAKSLIKLGISPTVFAIREFKDQVPEEEIEGVLYKRMPVYSRTSFRLFGYLKRAVRISNEFDFVVVNQFIPHLILPWVKVKKIAIIHDVYGKLKFWLKEYGIFRGIAGWIVEKFQMKFDKKYADIIFTVSESSKRKIITKLGDGVINKIQLLPNVVDSQKYHRTGNKENYLLFVGRFVGYKHPEHVLYVLHKVKELYPNFKAVFVVSRVENKVFRLFKETQKKLGIMDADIIINENCSYSELKNLYSNAKVLIQPSYAEGQGIVILESLASGTPVIAYDLDAYNGMLVDGENSILVEKGNVVKMALDCLIMLEGYDQILNNLDREMAEIDSGLFEKVLMGAFN